MKDKLSFLHPDMIYAEPLHSTGHAYQHNTKTYSPYYDLVPTQPDLCTSCPELGYDTNTQFYSQNQYIPSPHIQQPYARSIRSYITPGDQHLLSHHETHSDHNYEDHPGHQFPMLPGHPHTYQELVMAAQEGRSVEFSPGFWEKFMWQNY